MQKHKELTKKAHLKQLYAQLNLENKKEFDRYVKTLLVEQIVTLSEEECKQLYMDATRAGLIKEALQLVARLSDEQLKQLMQTVKKERA